MDWNEYQELAFNTNADLGNAFDNDTHMIFGMATEAGEAIDVYKKNMCYGKKIDRKNVKEELGDLCWYVAGMAYHNNIELSPKVVSTGLNSRDTIAVLIIDIGLIAMNRGRDRKGMMVGLLNSLLGHIMEFCAIEEMDFWRILENNIEKLQTRYPNNFTKESALVRDLDAEANILDE